MFKSLEIYNFRCFQNKTILLGKYVTILAGRNSTGKSTVLGMLGNSSELKVRDGAPYNTKQFRAEFSELFNGSEQFDPSGSEKYKIVTCDNDLTDNDYRKFRITWQTDRNVPGKRRFHIVPYRRDDQVNTSAKLKAPVLYLGLSRLFPIGEANHDRIQAVTPRFLSDEHKQWFVTNYKAILSMNDELTDISCVEIGEFDSKKSVGINTNNYDYLTNSSGQDNLGQILFSMLSFRKIKDRLADSWNGGLLLIDELDATLHPAAQTRLLDLMINEARNVGYQIVFTTHSTSLLKHICFKTIYNNDDTNNNVELYYFSTANRALDIRRNIDYLSIKGDLLVVSAVQNRSKIKTYSEDNETRWFLKKLIPDYLGYIEILDVSLGCSELMNLCKADTMYFGNSLIVLDGDVPDITLNILPLTVRNRLDNILKLPGIIRPEQLLYEYILSLPADHPYWAKGAIVDFTWQYFRDHGPLSNDYVGVSEREKYKKWFINHQEFFDITGLFDFWLTDNQQAAQQFRIDFIRSYNKIAVRLFQNRIIV